MIFRCPYVFVFVNRGLRGSELDRWLKLDRDFRNFIRLFFVLRFLVRRSPFFNPSLNEHLVRNDRGTVKDAKRFGSQRDVGGLPSPVVRGRGARIASGVVIPRNVRVVRGTRVAGSRGIRLLQDDDVASHYKGKAFGTTHAPITAGLCHVKGQVGLNVARNKAVNRVRDAQDERHLGR